MKKTILSILLLLSFLLSGCGIIARNPRPESTKPTGPEAAPVARDFSWIVTNGILTIKGHGAMPDFGSGSDQPWKAERNKITKVIISDGITRIGNEAFYHCNNLTQVQMPKSVTSIGKNAFRFCQKLTSIRIPENVTYIGDYAFGDCWELPSVALYRKVAHLGTAVFDRCQALTEISVESTNPYYSSENGILFNKDKTALIRYPTEGGKKTYFIPNTVTVIESGAFDACSNLEYIVIPSSVTTIGNFVFNGCYNLISLSIPGSVTSIGWDAFFSCASLTEVNVDITNPKYASQDGVFFTKGNKTLLHYPAGKTERSYAVPQGVTEIGGGAFEFNRTIVSVSVPEGVTAINANAFWNCRGLRSVEIPSSVVYIGSSAFSDCESFQSITFHGTKSQWESIDKDDFSNSAFTVYCTDGNIEVISG